MKNVFDIDSLIKIFQKERESRQWSHTTARSELGSLIGAMRRYDGHVLQAAFGMSRLPQKIIDFAHSIEKLMYQQFVPQQNSLTPEDVGKAISNAVLADDTEVAAFMIMMWGAAARPGDVEQLHKKDICLESDQLTITFCRGKAVVARGGPFTVHSTGGPWRPILAEFLRKATEAPFSQSTARRRARIRRYVGSRFGLRSWRRGALQAIGKAGVPEDVLRHFSGHKSLSMLLRYLGWGRWYGRMATEGRKAAAVLWY